jgi:hypothetical protein
VLSPQQYPTPLDVMAQVRQPPAATAAQRSDPATGTGTVLQGTLKTAEHCD